jgi:hypothetical protein
LLGGYLGQYRIRYHYIDSAQATPEWADDPAVGRRVPPVADNQGALRAMTWQLHTYGAGDVARPAVPEWMDGPKTFSADPQRRLRSDRLYLIRPDEFVAASIPLRHNIADAAQLRAALTTHCITTKASPNRQELLVAHPREVTTGRPKKKSEP